MINKNAVTLVGKIKRNVLVRKLSVGAAVFVPNLYILTVLDKRSKSLAETVYQLAD